MTSAETDATASERWWAMKEHIEDYTVGIKAALDDGYPDVADFLEAMINYEFLGYIESEGDVKYAPLATMLLTIQDENDEVAEEEEG